MYKRFLLVLLCLMSVALGWGYGYDINSFDVKMKVDSDATLHVEERINVTFNEVKHGIFRKIPVDYNRSAFSTRSIQIYNIRVTDGDGKKLETLVKKEGRELNIRIGSKDVTYARGTNIVYVITYDVHNAVNWIDQTSSWEPTAEIYWNATGDQWDVPISKSTVHVDFPTSPEGKGLRARVFTGPHGSQNEQVSIYHFGKEIMPSGSQASIKLQASSFDVWCGSALNPGSGLTFVLSLPKALVPGPTKEQAAIWFLRSNLGYAIPLIVGFALLILFLIFGKDRSGGPIVVQFDAPDGISGSEAGAMIDERVDKQDIVAGIISLATKGYLKIKQTDSTYSLTGKAAELELSLKNHGNDLTSFEEELLVRMEASGLPSLRDIDLQQHVAPYATRLQQVLYKSLVDKGFYLSSPDKTRAAWWFGGFVFTIVLGLICFVMSPFKNFVPSIIGGVIALLPVWYFGKEMPKRLPAGTMARTKILGFEEFMRRARCSELDWMATKQPDQLLFEKYLPHAVAFGLVREWAAAFENILTEYPSWYDSGSDEPFNSIYFSNNLYAVNQGLGVSSTVPYRSASSSGDDGSDGAGGGSSGFSSGGGFSGGGFGGGGGGSW